jgi:hypothetical protein
MKPIKLIVFILALAIVSIALIFNVKLPRSSANSTLQPPGVSSTPQKCFPTPQAAVIAGTRTPTPRRGQVVTPAPVVAATSLPLSKTTDLAPGLADEDKVYVYVMHCDGTFELFKVNPNIPLSQAIPLKPNDVILEWDPPASMIGHQPPSDNTIPTQSGTPMPLQPPPYPPPGTPYP